MLSVYITMLDTDEERDRFAELYEQQKSFLLKVAMRILSTRELSEDAVHDTFLSVIQHKEKIFNFSQHR